MSEEEDSLEEQYKDFESTFKEQESSKSQDPTPEKDSLDWDKGSEGKAVEDPEEKSEPEEEPVKKDINVPKDKTFDEKPESMDSIMREAMSSDPDLVKLEDEDKTAYIKAVLNDKPVILETVMCNDQMKVKIRSRTSWEQTCMYAALKQDQEEYLVTDLATVIIQLQKYGCALMVTEVNGSLFSDLELDQKDGLEESVKKLKAYKDEKIEVLSMPKWALLLNALRVFESKLSRMGTECLNANFWEPAD